MLTQDRLKEMLHYDEDTGIFTRKTKVANRLAGTVSGANHNKGYLQITIDGENFLAHRLVWLYVYGKWPQNQIDHINRNKKDNRILNLRDVSNSTNQMNIGLRSHNSSGVTGVVKSSKSHKPWAAQIHRNNKKIFLGYFHTVEEAKRRLEHYETSIRSIL